MMNTVQILQAIEQLPARTVGVYPADKIPLVLTKPTAIVVNNEDHTKPGSHWLAIYINEFGHGFYFDSFGLPPYVVHHLHRLQRNTSYYTWNVQQLQDWTSNVCGHYCVNFLYHMSYGHCFDSFLRLFTDNRMYNDKLTLKLFKINLRNRLHNKNKCFTNFHCTTHFQTCTTPRCKHM